MSILRPIQHLSLFLEEGTRTKRERERQRVLVGQVRFVVKWEENGVMLNGARTTLFWHFWGKKMLFEVEDNLMKVAEKRKEMC